MNANETTAIRELTVDEVNTVAGGEKYDGRGTYHFSIGGIVFSGDITHSCVSVPTGDGGWVGGCY